MKRVVFSLTLMLIIGSIFAQNAVNADGSLKLKGNVAILVNSSHFTFQNGVFVKAIDDKAISMLGTATRTLCMEKFVNYGFGVVNRDDEAYKQVLQLIEENKLEDYMDLLEILNDNEELLKAETTGNILYEIKNKVHTITGACDVKLKGVIKNERENE